MFVQFVVSTCTKNKEEIAWQQKGTLFFLDVHIFGKVISCVSAADFFASL